MDRYLPAPLGSAPDPPPPPQQTAGTMPAGPVYMLPPPPASQPPPAPPPPPPSKGTGSWLPGCLAAALAGTGVALTLIVAAALAVAYVTRTAVGPVTPATAPQPAPESHPAPRPEPAPAPALPNPAPAPTPSPSPAPAPRVDPLAPRADDPPLVASYKAMHRAQPQQFKQIAADLRGGKITDKVSLLKALSAGVNDWEKQLDLAAEDASDNRGRITNPGQLADLFEKMAGVGP